MRSRQEAPGQVLGSDGVANSGRDVRSGRQRRALLAIIVLLVLLLCAIAAAFVNLSTPLRPELSSNIDTEGWTFQRSLIAWGTGPDEALFRPSCAEFLPDGSLWVIDNNKAMRLIHYDKGASSPDQVLTLAYGSQPGQFGGTWGVDFDAEGNVYIADAANNRVQVITQSGERVREIDAHAPEAVLVDGDTLYVGELGSVARFTLQGDLLDRWGVRGRGDDEYDYVTGLDIADGVLYVAEGPSNRVKAIDANTGATIWITGTPPKDLNDNKGVFAYAADIMYTNQGLYVLDGLRSKTLVLDPDTGEVLKTVSEPGGEDGQLYQPRALALDPTGRIAAVADTFNNRVQFILLDKETLAEQVAGPRSFLGGLVGDGGGCVCLVPLGILVLLLLLGMVATRGVRRAERDAASSGTEQDEDSPREFGVDS